MNPLPHIQTEFLTFPHLLHMSDSITNLKTLLNAIEIKKYVGPKKDPMITNISLHSKCVGSNGMFFAIHGHKQSGEDFVLEAIANGAEVIVTETLLPHLDNIIQIQVENVRAAVAQLAAAFYHNPNEKLRTIGVTGTCGKSTTTWIIRHLYEEGIGVKIGLVGQPHIDLGERILPSVHTTPDAISLHHYFKEMVDGGLQNVVLEASSQGLVQQRLLGVQLDTAVFTNLSYEHIDYHHTLEAYYQAKRDLFFSHAIRNAVVNIDDPYGQRLVKELPSTVSVITTGIEQPATLQATDIRLSDTGTTFKLLTPKGGLTVKTQLLGTFNVYNCLSALGALYAQGYDLTKVVNSLKTFTGVPERLSPVKNSMGIKVFIDFAHKSDALLKTLNTLRECTRNKLYVVFGCADTADLSKRHTMTQIAETHADHAWATTDNPRFESQETIFNDMKQEVKDPSKIDFIENRKEAVYAALRQCRPGDCLLIAGKGNEQTISIKDRVIPYNDRKTVESYFEEALKQA
ncbi:MAG: UDP-N-acetylmuramoyl-L-alanyl-D-glutamate--2,6-diaminopimelate ligase [Opitutales bacterium]|nr:UDP-N-acetylmuramoyl-L-alanyl-D-glutamate--2,6-diaminopimelate ligase [Opitutales bacterium]